MDFTREENVERQDMHMARTFHENSQRVNGNYVEFETEDFNTLYTQILSQINYSSDDAECGYNMTEMLAQQLRLANNPNYMNKFNALAKRYSQIN